MNLARAIRIADTVGSNDPDHYPRQVHPCMTDSLQLVCSFKMDRSQTDMSECFGYSSTQRQWVATEPTGRPGEVAWKVAGPLDLVHFAPPPDEWYVPTSEGWKRVNVCDLIVRLALQIPNLPVPTYQMREAVQDQLRQDPEDIQVSCSYVVGSTQVFLEELTREWVQFSDGRWSMPDHVPVPEVSGWSFANAGSWQTGNVFTVIEHLVDRAGRALLD